MLFLAQRSLKLSACVQVAIAVFKVKSSHPIWCILYCLESFLSARKVFWGYRNSRLIVLLNEVFSWHKGCKCFSVTLATTLFGAILYAFIFFAAQRWHKSEVACCGLVLFRCAEGLPCDFSETAECGRTLHGQLRSFVLIEKRILT